MALLALGSAALASPGSAATARTTETLSGRTYLIVEAAIPELRRRVLYQHLANYRIKVFDRGSGSVIVGFYDPEQPDSVIGDGGRFPALEVEVDAGSLKVLGSHYVK